ncbi:hypothetical protein F5Y00DRAFT_130748 [Daldinia vernicosa]|uniref:uncharacterized protein n=1 Tax=Daldinia vernicosa TaxID=114800 RepID=UPI00200899BE|nr:uncharacterized protein F5Y00DRAFT_130748 [Daldinia vernicosa]KAI0853036.1 hypothetical protein F5Y00DRAFT_130748 [Daldinia vernicosa]
MSHTFHWGLDGLDKPRFEAYTKILSLRNGGQAGDVITFDPCEAGLDVTEPAEDGDSIAGQPLTNFDNDKLKRAFLDRLSEILSHTRGGYQVAAALMIENLGVPEVTVAKNSGLKQTDKDFITALEKVLGRIVGCLISLQDTNELRELILTQYTPRVKGYISDLQKYLNQGRIQLMKQSGSDTIRALAVQIEALSLVLNQVPHDLNKIVLEAYHIRTLHNMSIFEQIQPEKPSVGRQIGDLVYLLSRPHVALLTFVRAIERIEGFDKLRVRWVEFTSLIKKAPLAKGQPMIPPWTVGQVFKSLGLKFNDVETRALMHSGADKSSTWNRDKLVNRFGKLKATENNIHAEVQLVLDLSKRGVQLDHAFKYVGCSKRSCLLCYSFLSTTGFACRGCHGKVYELWTIPELDGISEGSLRLLSEAVKKLQSQVTKSLRHNTKPRPHVKESTVGGSSIATVVPHTEDQHLATLIRNHLQTDREHSILRAPIIRPISPQSEDTLSETPSRSRLPVEHETEGECKTCDNITSRRCTLCGRDWYCSEHCQKQMRLYHIFYCNLRPLTTADYLCRDCFEDRMPDDPEVLDDFGFNRCKTRDEQSHLLGVYIGLFKYFDVPSETVDGWRRNGILLDQIAQAFNKIPEESRGKYFPWLLRNTHLLSQDKTVEPSQESPKSYLARVFEEARPYLKGQDSGKTMEQLEPLDKRRCFTFFALTLQNSSPPPIELAVDQWYDFGFATCIGRDLTPEGIQHSEGWLGGLYSTLLFGRKARRAYCKSLGIPYDGPPDPPICPFDEFYRAWSSYTLPSVFDKYGYGDRIDEWPFFRKFISTKPEKRAHVWRLLQYIAIGELNAIDSTPKLMNAAKFYGISSHVDTRERLALYEFYRQLLGVVDPLSLEEACEQGTLLRFALEHLGTDMDTRVKSSLVRLDLSKRTRR